MPEAPATPAAETPTQTAAAYQQIESLFGGGSTTTTAQAMEDSAKAAKEAESKSPTQKEDKSRPQTEPTTTSREVSPETAEKVETPPKDQQQSAPKERARTLREALDTTKRENSELRSKLAEAEKKLAAPKESPPELKTLQDQLSAEKKAREEYENEIKFTKYEKSPEFREKYQAPYEAAYKEGAELISTFTFKEADKTDPTTGDTVAGATRKGTEEDWYNLITMPREQANKYAQDHFGYNAPDLLAQRLEVAKLVKARNAALDEYRTKGLEREKQTAAEREASDKRFSEDWQAARKWATEQPQWQDWFKVDEADPKAKEVAQKGLSIAERAFGDQSKLSHEDRVQLNAAAFNKIAFFDHVAYKLRQTVNKLAEAEKKLKEFEDTEPGHQAGARKIGGEPKKEGYAAADDYLDRVAR